MYYLPQTAVRQMNNSVMQVKERSWVSEYVPLDIFQAADVCMASFSCLRIFCCRSLVMHLIPIGGNVWKIWALWAVLQLMKSSQTSEPSSTSKVGFMVSQRCWRYKEIVPWEMKHFKEAHFQLLKKRAHPSKVCLYRFWGNAELCYFISRMSLLSLRKQSLVVIFHTTMFFVISICEVILDTYI